MTKLYLLKRTTLLDKENIIESGLLECYALGLLSPTESIEFETYLGLYPELMSDIVEIQLTVQAYAFSQGVTPRKNLEKVIVNNVRSNR